MKPLKICIFTTDFSPTKGGIASLSENLSLSLSKSAEVSSVKVIALKNISRSTETINEKYEVCRFQTKSLFQLFFQVGRQVFLNRKSDIFHATTVFPIGFFLIIFCWIIRKPVFVSYYGTDLLTNEGSILTKWAKRFAVLKSTKSIALGENTKKLVEEKLSLPKDHSVVISYALPDSIEKTSVEEVNKVRKEFGINETDFVILYVGNLINRKGCHDLFDAVATIEDATIKLIFAGKGLEEQALRMKQKSLNLEDKIFFAGRRENISAFYELAHVFSMPSYYDKESGDIEGLGIVFLEAAQHEVPSVATLSGGIPDAIIDGETGFLVEERNVNELREKILLFKDNENLRRNLGLNAKKFVEEKFNWKKSVAEHIALYKKSI